MNCHHRGLVALGQDQEIKVQAVEAGMMMQLTAVVGRTVERIMAGVIRSPSCGLSGHQAQMVNTVNQLAAVWHL